MSNDNEKKTNEKVEIKSETKQVNIIKKKAININIDDLKKKFCDVKDTFSKPLNIIKPFFTFNSFAKIAISLGFIVITCIIIYTLFHIASNTTFSCDDFIHAQYAYNFGFNTEDLFKGGIDYGLWQLQNLGGNYFAMFLQHFLGPLNSEPFENLRKVMSMNVIFYFLSMLFLCFSISKNLIYNIKGHILDSCVLSAFIWMMLSFTLYAMNIYYEVFTWFSGSTSYSFPMSCFFVSLGSALFLYNADNKYLILNIILTLISSFFGFCAMGANAEVAFFSILMLGITMFYFVNKKMPVYVMIILAVYIYFVIVNVTAPGNINRRHATYANDFGEDSTYILVFSQVVDYMKKAIGLRLEEINTNIFKKYVLIASGLFVGARIERDKEIGIGYALASIVMLFVPFIIILPVAYCYTAINTFYFPDRVMFSLDLALHVNIINIFIIVGYSFAKLIEVLFKDKANASKIVKFLPACFILLYALYFKYDTLDFNRIYLFRAIDSYLDNSYVVAKEMNDKIVRKLFDSNGKESVTISKSEFPKDKTDTMELIVTSSPEIEKYFGVKHIYVR